MIIYLFYKFIFNIYLFGCIRALFGCIRAQLWHARSSLWPAGSFFFLVAAFKLLVAAHRIQFPELCSAKLILSSLTLCDPVNCSPPGSSVHRIPQARILEWVAILFFRGSSRSRNRTHVSCSAGMFFTTEPPGKPTHIYLSQSESSTTLQFNNTPILIIFKNLENKKNTTKPHLNILLSQRYACLHTKILDVSFNQNSEPLES